MKKRIKIYTIILAMIFWGVHGVTIATSSENEDINIFLDIINQIRNDPYSYAIGLGYAPGVLIESEILPETHFDPYCADDFLTARAAEDNALMTGEQVPPDPQKPIHLLTAQTGGVVSFFNFMPRDTAFKIVIDNLFIKELDTQDFQYILSDTYSSAGVAISPGRVADRGNAWFVAIRLGSSERVSEIQMLNLINQVRSNPWDILKYTELDQAEIYNNNQAAVVLLTTDDYHPLFFNASLSASARSYSNQTYPEFLEDTPLKRAGFFGYAGEDVQKFALAVPSLSEYNGLSVDELFISLIGAELGNWPNGYPVLLNEFQDIGSSISFQAGDKIDVSVLSFVVGVNNQNVDNIDQIPRIYGVLFSDDDGNGLYSPGEELVQQTVTVYAEDMQAVKTVVTDNAGHFSMRLDANTHYRFMATIEDVPVVRDIFISSDQFVKMVFSPPFLSPPL